MHIGCCTKGIARIPRPDIGKGCERATLMSNCGRGAVDHVRLTRALPLRQLLLHRNCFGNFEGNVPRITCGAPPLVIAVTCMGAEGGGRGEGREGKEKARGKGKGE